MARGQNRARKKAAAPFGPLPDRICFLDGFTLFSGENKLINPVDFSRSGCVKRAFGAERKGGVKNAGGDTLDFTLALWCNLQLKHDGTLVTLLRK